MHSWFRIQKWILENRKDSRSSKLVLLIQTVWCHTYQMLSVILYICLLYWHECAKSIFIGNHNLKFFTILVSHIEFFILLTKNMLVFSLFFLDCDELREFLCEICCRNNIVYISFQFKVRTKYRYWLDFQYNVIKYKNVCHRYFLCSFSFQWCFPFVDNQNQETFLCFIFMCNFILFYLRDIHTSDVNSK